MAIRHSRSAAAGMPYAPHCLSGVPATEVDAAFAHLVLEMMTPISVEMTLAIQSELDRRVAEANTIFRRRITRAASQALKAIGVSFHIGKTRSRRPLPMTWILEQARPST
jgi:hypothetical protein